LLGFTPFLFSCLPLSSSILSGQARIYIYIYIYIYSFWECRYGITASFRIFFFFPHAISIQSQRYWRFSSMSPLTHITEPRLVYWFLGTLKNVFVCYVSSKITNLISGFTIYSYQISGRKLLTWYLSLKWWPVQCAFFSILVMQLFKLDLLLNLRRGFI